MRMPDDTLSTLPSRKRLNHRGPLSIDVSSAWYFMTLCADGHAPWVVDEAKIGRAVAPRPPKTRFELVASLILHEAHENHVRGIWRLALFLVMPDHLHFIAQFPDGDGGHAGRVTLPMVTLIQQFKSYLVRAYGIRFQRDFFDTRLRDDAHFAEKCEYVLGNPVRKGLCVTPEEWPHSIAFSRGSTVGSRVPRDRVTTNYHLPTTNL